MIIIHYIIIISLGPQLLCLGLNTGFTLEGVCGSLCDAKNRTLISLKGSSLFALVSLQPLMFSLGFSILWYCYYHYNLGNTMTIMLTFIAFIQFLLNHFYYYLKIIPVPGCL